MYARAGASKESSAENKKNTGPDLKGVGLISKAWENNVGTQNLANSKGSLMSSRTKHIDIKYN